MKDERKTIIGKITIPENYFVNMDFSRSMHYDKHIIWKNDHYTSPVELFVDKIYYDLKIDYPKLSFEHKKNALNNLVCNLIRGVENGRLISMWRTKGAYTMPKMYGMQHYTYNNIVGSFDKLYKLEYVDMKKGYYDRAEKKGKVTRIWATEKLIKNLNELSLISYSLSANIGVYFDPDAVNITSENFTKLFYQNPVILKDAQKIRIIYENTRAVYDLKKFLNFYNDFITSFNITLPITYTFSNNTTLSNSSIQYSSNSHSYPLLGMKTDKCLYYKRLDCRLYRVFNNGKFDQGGRFYGGDYQRLSEEQRAKILIDGESVVEVDYSGLHGRMIYHYYEKIDYLDDPYLINGNKELRPAFKKMFQMCINATGKIASVRAFRKSLVEDEDGWELKKLMHKYNVSPEWLYEKLFEKHQKISKFFSSGVGIKLQFIDSQIAENILKHFMRKGIACLCIHDSFIVQERYKDELIEVMRKEYKRKIGFECLLKIEGKIC